jgi:hypothetical protein
MIHPESQQLFIGPYVIDAQRSVRVIPPARMPGRPTRNARHLSDPAGKIYCATMEEGLDEVDVQSLAVKNLIRDGNALKKDFFFELPAENADGFAKIRPVCSHDLRVTGFGGYRGLFLMSGLMPDAKAGDHILRSDDAKAALWAGAIDDLWKLGKPGVAFRRG